MHPPDAHTQPLIQVMESSPSLCQAQCAFAAYSQQQIVANISLNGDFSLLTIPTVCRDAIAENSTQCSPSCNALLSVVCGGGVGMWWDGYVVGIVLCVHWLCFLVNDNCAASCTPHMCIPYPCITHTSPMHPLHMHHPCIPYTCASHTHASPTQVRSPDCRGRLARVPTFGLGPQMYVCVCVSYMCVS